MSSKMRFDSVCYDVVVSSQRKRRVMNLKKYRVSAGHYQVGELTIYRIAGNHWQLRENEFDPIDDFTTLRDAICRALQRQPK